MLPGHPVLFKSMCYVDGRWIHSDSAATRRRESRRSVGDRSRADARARADRGAVDAAQRVRHVALDAAGRTQRGAAALAR
jgi:aspartate-semialdehyde dehydrogenase